jgi:hypothetical protein
MRCLIEVCRFATLRDSGADKNFGDGQSAAAKAQ